MTLWAAKWRRTNKRDGIDEPLICENSTPVLFRTRADTRQFIEEVYGYIKHRIDLRKEPFGWKKPIPVKVVVKEASDDDG